ncbi:hypothetical protein [Halorientalis pallida]|uniref:Uncharacterized protein n=1 Tax=Halorientalis pallida TaxID=2479928 RepID=A0A498KSC5_9EURY|nr:hypothetical protein [Halorientalis pallida]RXK47418.1 hypothetical protein EAF64_16725 [Halorientalis pallida]
MSDASSDDVSAVVRVRETVADWFATSRTGQTLTAVVDRFETAAAGSTTRGVIATLGDWVRASWSYRWLTAEPDPDVIVVDLRETYTIGPIIRVLDRVVDPIADAWDGSSAQATADSVVDAPVRALGIVAVVAVLVETALSLVLGNLGQSGLLVRAILFGFATLATQVPLSASELAETRTGRLLRAVLEPPEPPGEETDRPEKQPNDDDSG